MKTIAVVLPVNNPDILNQQDLQSYQSEDFFFKVTYAKTSLKELNTPADVAAVMPAVLNEIKAAEQAGASVVIVYGFGDVGVKESRNLVSIPVMGLGKSVVHMASLFCRRRYSVLPAQLAHNVFIEALVKEEGLQDKFVLASHSINLNPAEIRDNPLVLDRLFEAASAEIAKNDIDTFTLGCASFFGVAKLLQEKLREHHRQAITVFDPVAVPLKIAMALA